MNNGHIFTTSSHEQTFELSTKTGQSLLTNITYDILDSYTDNKQVRDLLNHPNETLSEIISGCSETFRTKCFEQQRAASGVLARQMVERCLWTLEAASKKKAEKRRVESGEMPIRKSKRWKSENEFPEAGVPSSAATGHGGRGSSGGHPSDVQVATAPVELPISIATNAPQSQSSDYYQTTRLGFNQRSAPTQNTLIPLTEKRSSTEKVFKLHGAIKPLSEYDATITQMTYRDIHPLRDYYTTWRYCDKETQKILEDLSMRLSKVDINTLIIYQNDTGDMGGPNEGFMKSIAGERSDIFLEFYCSSPEKWERRGRALSKLLVERAIQLNRIEDHQKQAQRVQAMDTNFNLTTTGGTTSRGWGERSIPAIPRQEQNQAQAYYQNRARPPPQYEYQGQSQNQATGYPEYHTYRTDNPTNTAPQTFTSRSVAAEGYDGRSYPPPYEADQPDRRWPGQ